MRQGFSNGFPIFAPALVLTFRNDHALFKKGKNEQKLFFALDLPAQNATSLLGFAAPLAMSVNDWRRDHLFHLLVGIGIRAGDKFIKPIPQRSDHGIDHLSRDIQ